MNLSSFLTELIAKGYQSFTFAQAKAALAASDIAVRAALRRAKQKGELAQPVKGFYVIVPPEYRILGCRPAEHFIDELMQYLNTPYYLALLSAAQFHGAAHHRPQQSQIAIKQKRRAIICGQVKIVFITQKNCEKIPTQSFNTHYGNLIVSSPEATAMDMVNYPHHCGGLDNVLNVLTDLAKKIDGKKLFQLATSASEINWVQRLGYLFDLIKAEDLSAVLLKAIENRRRHIRPLVIRSKQSSELQTFASKLQKNKTHLTSKNINKKWGLIINKKLELEK